MKKSIRTKLFAAMALCIVFVVVLCIILNVFALQKYYIGEKTKMLVGIRGVVNDLYKNNTDTDDIYLKLEQISNNKNIHIMISDADGAIVYTSLPKDAIRFEGAVKNLPMPGNPNVESGLDENQNEYDFKTRMGGRINQHNGNRQAVETTDKYIIYNVFNPMLESKEVEMVASLDNGYNLRLQMAVESINESVKYSNTFLVFAGILSIIIALMLVFIFSRSFTQPIKELSDISRSMAGLDFTKKYTRKSEDEIGVLGESINSLSERLEKTISELKEANIELKKDILKKEEIDKQRLQFLSNVSHELKTPISLIEAYAEGLSENIILDDENRKYYCEVIMDETDKMSIIIKKLMALMELESGKDKLDINQYNIVEQIDEILIKKQILFDQNNIKVKFNKYEPIFVWADEFLIEEVIVNYLTNAIKYNNDKKIIDINVQKFSGKVRVNVYNSGENIAQEDLDKIWESFYMVDKARTRDRGSQGLGLSIVAAILKAHNMKYGVENLSDGVNFWFELDGSV